jgi:hypothetical protein
VAETSRLISQIARAIVHLNFDEPEQAREVLFDALTDFNFNAVSEKENSNGNAAA